MFTYGQVSPDKALEDWMEKAMQGALRRRRHRSGRGDANLTTTLRYVHLSPEAKDAAVRLLGRRPTGEAGVTEGVAPGGNQRCRTSGNAAAAG